MSSAAEPPSSQPKSATAAFLLILLLAAGSTALVVWLEAGALVPLSLFFLACIPAGLLLGRASCIRKPAAGEADDAPGTMLEGIRQFAGETVADIMTARPNVCDLDAATPFREVLATIARDGYSRVPVYSGNKDNIVGVLYSKDLLPHLSKSDKFRWSTLLRPALCVPESKKIDNLLREFQQKKIHIAVAIDEYGGVSGIVTLEDIIEEIIGEINDEYDETTRPYILLDDGSYIFRGTYGVQDFLRLFALPPAFFSDDQGDDPATPLHGDTLAGLLPDLTGDVVSRHQTITYKQFVFEILETTERVITKVKVSVSP